MARKLKIQAQQTKTIAEAFSDFLLCKKALGVSDKTLKTYSQHFSAICKYLDSSTPIGGLFKRPLEEMIEQMRSSNLKDTSINSYTRTLKSFLSWCNEEGLTETNISLFRYQEVIKETYDGMYIYTAMDSMRCILLLCQRNRKRAFLFQKSSLLAGAVGFFLLARRSSVRAALTCHWHVIHSRPILILLPHYGKQKRPV